LGSLVSPAPESFHILHSLLSKINDEVECFDRNFPAGKYNNDLKALSSFLIKDNYSLVLYLDSDLVKWKIEPGCINLCNDIEESQIELYHKHNTLELSRMASDIAAKNLSNPVISPKIHHLARQAEVWNPLFHSIFSIPYCVHVSNLTLEIFLVQKRLTLTMGSDLRGPTASDACFNFSLAGLQHSDGLFRTLTRVGIHELKRTGRRASFKPTHVLHMVEKFAACDIQGQYAIDLYHDAGECLETKGYDDFGLIKSLKDGNFGFHSPRPLIWLWRFSSRQKKLSTGDSISNPKGTRSIGWAEIFDDTSKPLVVDIGSGLGASLLNLSTLTNNYDAKYFCTSAENFLSELQFYTGGTALIMINFPSPYRLSVTGSGNSQLPTMNSNQFMVTKEILEQISRLLSKSDDVGGENFFLFQTKCEDVAVLVKNECLALGTLEPVPCKNPMKDIDIQYENRGKRPKRVDDWLTPLAERAEGSMYSSTPLLPTVGRPETEVQCSYENSVVHRLLFRRI